MKLSLKFIVEFFDYDLLDLLNLSDQKKKLTVAPYSTVCNQQTVSCVELESTEYTLST